MWNLKKIKIKTLFPCQTFHSPHFACSCQDFMLTNHLFERRTVMAWTWASKLAILKPNEGWHNFKGSTPSVFILMLKMNKSEAHRKKKGNLAMKLGADGWFHVYAHQGNSMQLCTGKGNTIKTLMFVTSSV